MGNRHKILFLLGLVIGIGFGFIAVFYKPPLVLNQCIDCNVILISLDACRADHMSIYGYERNTTPNLDSLDNVILFTEAIAPTFYTPTSHATMLTGLEPFEHNVTNFGIRLPDDLETIAEYLGKRDYYTVGVVNVEHISEKYGFDQGFDRFQLVGVDDAEHVTDAAINGLSDLENGSKFFLFVHYFQLHAPYKTKEAFSEFINKTYEGILKNKTVFEVNESEFNSYDLEYVNDNYDGDVLYADHEISRIIDFLKARGDYNRTVIIITADHGEMLGEEIDQKPVFGHSSLLYPTLRIPLMIISPNNPGRTIKSAFGLDQVTDVIKYILGYSGRVEMKKGIFSYIPFLEDVLEILSHRIARFSIMDGDDLDILSVYNLSTERISEMQRKGTLENYFLSDFTKGFSCDGKDFSLVIGGYFTNNETNKRTMDFIEEINCEMLEKIALNEKISLPENVEFMGDNLQKYVYSYITSDENYFLDYEKNLYHFDLKSWADNREINMLPAGFFDNVFFYMNTMQFIEKTPPFTLINQ
jgi:hypothetical protein